MPYIGGKWSPTTPRGQTYEIGGKSYRSVRPTAFADGSAGGGGRAVMASPGLMARFTDIPERRGGIDVDTLVRLLQTERSPSKRARYTQQLADAGYSETGERIQEEIQPTEEEALGQTIYGEREEALRLAEEDRERALAELETQRARDEDALLQARKAGLMGEEEYQGALAENKEATEAQFDRISREMGEGMGGLTMGARRGATRELEMGRVGELGRGRRGITTERATRRATAYGTWGQQMAGLGQQYGLARAGIMERAERPYYDIPAGASPGLMLGAMTGGIKRIQPAPQPGVPQLGRSQPGMVRPFQPGGRTQHPMYRIT